MLGNKDKSKSLNHLLCETIKDCEKDWKKIWKQLKFGNEAPQELELLKWLKEQPLYGNFRDLQKIAMYNLAFIQFAAETRSMLKEKTAFQYAKNEIKKYYSQVSLLILSYICVVVIQECSSI